MKKDIIITALLTFCLTATVFMVATSRSAEYDPWVDLNDDGKIDIFDVVGMTSRYAATGNPTKNVTVTNWPTKRTLDASLAYNLVIELGTYEFEADVEGYSKVTLLLQESYGGNLVVYVWFTVGGVGTPNIYADNTLAAGSHFLLQSYEVIGATITISVTTYQTAMISLGIYATD